MAKSSKATLAITREQFRTAAKPITVVINGKEYTAAPKEFSTGSLGWYLNGKVSVEVDGVPVPVQIGLNLTVVGSKELPADEAPAGPAGAAVPSEPEA